MRHPMPIVAALTLALAALVGLVACQKPAAPGKAPAEPVGTVAPAPAPGGVQVLDPLGIDALAARAALDAPTRGKVAPHVAAMNAELKQLRTLTATAPRNAPKAQQDKLHADLQGHLAAFQKHWDEADALLTPAQKAAFDAAVREGLGARPVGNPHQNLPADHPRLDAKGGKAGH